MKRMLWMLVTLLLAGCEQSPIEEQSATGAEEFYATFANDSDSRTFLDEQLRLRWTADDRITIFKKEAYNREFAFTGVTGSNAGGFRQVSVDDDFYYGATLPYNYAAYPHSNTMSFHEDGYFTLTMPAEQSYAENSVGLGANTMVAASETGKLMFKNVGSFLRVQLYGADQTVKKITLSSNAGEALAGEAKVYPSLTEDPTCTMVGTTSSIVLNCAETVRVNTTEDAPVSFWIVVPPCTLSEGYKVTVENADGETQEFFVNKEKAFTRNVYSTLKRELTIGQTIDTSSAVPSNQIWYTSSDETMIGIGDDVVGQIIKSHTYENGKGIITFNSTISKVGNFRDSELSSISLPATITEISSFAFWNCSSLTNISIPSGVTQIGDYAFSGCAKLGEIIIPDGIIKIGKAAFKNCKQLTTSLPNSITAIGAEAFYGCRKLDTTIPAKLTKIEDNTFAGCWELTNGDLVIHEGVQSIGKCAFHVCESIKRVFLPSSLKYIGAYAFVTLTELDVHIADLSHWLTLDMSHENDFQYPPFGETGTDANPLEHNYFYDLYVNNELITDLIIPDEITIIKQYAFTNCGSIKSVTLHDKVSSINRKAFTYCKNLETINDPSLSHWCNIARESICMPPSYDLYTSNNLATDIIIPEQCTTIPFGAFEGCRSITSVQLHNRITTLGPRALSNCANLKTINIPYSVENIDWECFLNSRSLESIDIAEGVKIISQSAFDGCSKLVNVCLPSSIEKIGYYAFRDCSNLQKVYCKASTPPEIIDLVYEWDAFYGHAASFSIMVPKGSVETYKKAKYWKDYADYIEEYEF